MSETMTTIVTAIYIITALSILPLFIWALIANINVHSTFNRYSSVPNQKDEPAAKVARDILDREGIKDISIVAGKGKLTDNFNPRKKVISLSENVFNSSSISAIGVAAHECGHAIQHKNPTLFYRLRTFFAPICTFASFLFIPIFIVGIILTALAFAFGPILLIIAVVIYFLITLFTFITLPVEYDASRKAIKALEQSSLLNAEEIVAVKKVLKSAARTYLISFILSLAEFLRFFTWLLLSFVKRR